MFGSREPRASASRFMSLRAASANTRSSSVRYSSGTGEDRGTAALILWVVGGEKVAAQGELAYAAHDVLKAWLA